MDAPNYVQGLYTVAERDAIFTKANKYPDAANGLQNQVPTIFPDGSIGWRQIPEGGDGTANANIAVVVSTQYASRDYTYGEWLIYNDQLYQVIKPIAAGEEMNQSNTKSIRVDHEALTRISKGKNLLRNWFFKGGGSQQGGGQYPINQRGLTSYTAVGGTIDGWFQTGGTTTVSANFIQHVSPANESSDFYQIVDLPYASDIYTDMSLTFSAVAASRFRYGTAVINSDLLTETVVVSYNSFQLILQLILPDKIKATIRVFAGETVTMSMAKLEFGQRQTLMSDLGTPPTWDAPPDYQTELLRCSDGFTPLVGKGVNLLDNAYFIGGGAAGAFPVNQRYPQTVFNVDEKTDRWAVTGFAGTLTLNSGYATLVSTGAFTVARQKIYRPLKLGDVVAISILTDSNCFFATGALPSDSTPLEAIIDEATGSRIQVFMGGDGYPYFDIISVSGVTINIKAVKLEVGSQQTLARQVNGAWALNDPPPDYGQELAKCQRYLQVFEGWEYTPIGHVYPASATQLSIAIPLTVPMKGAFASIGAGTTVYVSTNGGWNQTVTIPASSQNVRLSPNFAQVDVTLASALLGTFPSMALLSCTPTTKLIISAE